MAPFWEQKKPQRTKRPAKTLKNILQETLVREVNKDPELKKRLAFKAAGYEELLGDNKEITDARQKIDMVLTSKALEMLSNNDELASAMATEKLADIIGKKNIRHLQGSSQETEEEYDQSDGSPLDAAMDELTKAERFKEALGIKPKGFMDVIKDPEILVGIMSLLKSFVQPGQVPGQSPQSPQEQMVMVMVEGKPQLIPVSKCNLMLQQGTIKPVGSVQKTDQVESEKSQETEPVNTNDNEENTIELEQPDEPKKIGSAPEIDLTNIQNLSDVISLADYIVQSMSGTPEEFVEEMVILKNSGDESAKIAFNFLCNTDADTIFALVTPYKDNVELASYVSKLIDNREWVEQVIELVKKQ